MEGCAGIKPSGPKAKRQSFQEAAPHPDDVHSEGLARGAQPTSLCWALSPPSSGAKVISCASPREPGVSFCIPRTQINQPLPRLEMATLPRNLHICILLLFPEFNFLQELILITLFKQRGFGVYTNVTFSSCRICRIHPLPLQFKGTTASVAGC